MESYPEDYPGGMMEGYPDSEYFDGWGWEDNVVPVPGFGFFPSVMKEELEEEAEDFLREVRVSLLKKLGPGRPSAGGPRMDRRAVTSPGVVKISRQISS